LNIELLEQACSFVKKKIGDVPEIALVLGSGLGQLADALENPVSIPYKDIPGFPVSTAPGHASRLVCGTLDGIRVLTFKGRFHHYEGYTMEQVSYPIRFLKLLGCKTLVLTNAAGGINRSFTPGDLMLISDHINFTGKNPLIGPNYDAFGPRFPDLSNAYNSNLRALVKDAANELDIPLKEGVYAWMTGPSFETPAEIKMLESMGADAIGMSTVPEVITAVHSGIKVVGISCISNMAAGILDQPITAEEVMEIGQQVSRDFSSLILRFLSKLGNIQ
jgi:purine-nucleoside phosphorylase